MTTDIERQFFDTFGIEPREFKSCDVDSFCPYEGQICSDTCPYYKTYKVDYPAITDSILLELICINAKSQDMYQDYYRIRSRDYNNLKIEILGDCMCEIEDIKQQVQSLFKDV